MSQPDPNFTCDGCGADLTRTGYEAGYRLVLSSQRKLGPGGGGAVFSMRENDPIEPLHFCDIDCLATWMVTTHERIFVPGEAA